MLKIEKYDSNENEMEKDLKQKRIGKSEKTRNSTTEKRKNITSP